MTKPEVVGVVELSCVRDLNSIRTVVYNYFSSIVWSAEKSEWDAMSESEREQFVHSVVKYINRGE